MAGNGRAARAQAPAVRIGVLSDMSGPYRDISGPELRRAGAPAVQDFGAAARGLHVRDPASRPPEQAGRGRERRPAVVRPRRVDAILEVNNSAIAMAINGWRGKRTRST
jgi:branched-chain amino acid transport system substrate-binding protein